MIVLYVSLWIGLYMVHNIAGHLHNILVDLEKQFHQFFYSSIEEMKLTNLTNLRQRNDESVAAFIQRFRYVKNWCFSLVLSDQQLAEVAFQELLPHIKEKYSSQEFYSISQMANKMTGGGKTV